MRRSRYREDRSDSGRSLAVAIAAVLAGVALGVLISHRMGGLEGIKARVKKRFRRGGLDLERLREFADEAFADEDDLGEEPYEPWEDEGGAALEGKVLAAFLADDIFRERPVDISARDSEVVELTGMGAEQGRADESDGGGPEGAGGGDGDQSTARRGPRDDRRRRPNDQERVVPLEGRDWYRLRGAIGTT